MHINVLVSVLVLTYKCACCMHVCLYATGMHVAGASHCYNFPSSLQAACPGWCRLCSLSPGHSLPVCSPYRAWQYHSLIGEKIVDDLKEFSYL